MMKIQPTTAKPCSGKLIVQQTEEINIRVTLRQDDVVVELCTQSWEGTGEGWFALPEAQGRAVPAGGTEIDVHQMGPK